MIICSCNVLSDHEIRLVATAAAEEALSPCQVHKCLGCRVQCGRCARAIRRIITEAATACPSGRARCPVQAATAGPAISVTQPGPDEIEKRNPCSLTMALTRLSPRPTPGSRRLLSER